MAVQPIPDNYHTVTSYLYVNGAAKAIEFYKSAFGAEEILRMDRPDGKIMHAEIKIGDSPVMLADEFPEMDAVGPASRGGATSSLLIYVEDVDTIFQRAVGAGGTVVRPVGNQFYGDRTGTLKDPFGHVWTISTHVEDVSPEELERRSAEMFKKGGDCS